MGKGLRVGQKVLQKRELGARKKNIESGKRKCQLGKDATE